MEKEMIRMEKLKISEHFNQGKNVSKFDEILTQYGKFKETVLDTSDFDMVLEIPRHRDDTYRYFIASDEQDEKEHVYVFRVEKK